MYAVEPRRQAQVGTVIHDQFDGIAQATFQFPGLLEHLTGVAGLVAVLQQGDAASDEFFGSSAQGFGIRKEDASRIA